MRGKQYRAASTSVRVGITPADAGKTGTHHAASQRQTDHPRGCGENASILSDRRFFAGSPPRMRGKQSDMTGRPSMVRITPADAGKTGLNSSVALL